MLVMKLPLKALLLQKRKHSLQPIEPPLQADASAKISLAFDAKNYESMSTTVDNKGNQISRLRIYPLRG